MSEGNADWNSVPDDRTVVLEPRLLQIALKMIVRSVGRVHSQATTPTYFPLQSKVAFECMSLSNAVALQSVCMLDLAPK